MEEAQFSSSSHAFFCRRSVVRLDFLCRLRFRFCLSCGNGGVLSLERQRLRCLHRRHCASGCDGRPCGSAWGGSGCGCCSLLCNCSHGVWECGFVGWSCSLSLEWTCLTNSRMRLFSADYHFDHSLRALELGFWPRPKIFSGLLFFL